MDFNELRKQSGMNLTQFSRFFGIPYRTIQNWERGERKCPEYLIDLMKYKLEQESSDIYLISLDSSDGYHEYSHTEGYIRGTEEEASAYCAVRESKRSVNDVGEFLYQKIHDLQKDK